MQGKGTAVHMMSWDDRLKNDVGTFTSTSDPGPLHFLGVYHIVQCPV